MKKYSKGFTLIEILIVMLILGFVISLIGPRLFILYKAIQVSAEEKRVEEIIERVKMVSFLRQVSHTIRLDGQTITVMNNDIKLKLRHLYFPSKFLTFNRNGFSDISKIRYLVGKKERFMHVS
jgi:prepilin-type N-terminal cleavage/methylation domain-containing protein